MKKNGIKILAAVFGAVILIVIAIFCIQVIGPNQTEKENGTVNEISMDSDVSQIGTQEETEPIESELATEEQEIIETKPQEPAREPEAEVETQQEETQPVESEPTQEEETEIPDETVESQAPETEAEPEEPKKEPEKDVTEETQPESKEEPKEEVKEEPEVEQKPTHTHSYVTDSKEATCASNGYTKTYCSGCGLVKSESVVNATGQHNYSGTVTTAATCGTEGVMTYSCSGCGDSYTEAIPATGNCAMFETSRENALCHQDGWIIYTCAYCCVTRTDVLPALGGEHAWVETWFIEPTCSSSGSGHGQTCSKCGYHEKLPENDVTLGHLADAGTVVIPGDCINTAIISHVCVRCGCDMPDTDGPIDPNNHSWDFDTEYGLWYCGLCGTLK